MKHPSDPRFPKASLLSFEWLDWKWKPLWHRGANFAGVYWLFGRLTWRMPWLPEVAWTVGRDDCFRRQMGELAEKREQISDLEAELKQYRHRITSGGYIVINGAWVPWPKTEISYQELLRIINTEKLPWSDFPIPVPGGEGELVVKYTHSNGVRSGLHVLNVCKSVLVTPGMQFKITRGYHVT
jgi:hypothetical protein